MRKCEGNDNSLSIKEKGINEREKISKINVNTNKKN